MEEKLYTRVQTAKRKPEIDGEYFTSRGMLWWNVDEFTDYNSDEFKIKQPRFWFEETQAKIIGEANAQANVSGNEAIKKETGNDR